MYRPFEELPLSGRCVCVVGSGGKTTLLRRLSERLPGTVILTTSTRVYPFPGVPLIPADADRGRVLKEIESALASNRVACVGTPLPTGKLSAPSPGASFEDLLSLADTVLIEGDGSAGLPLKAHRPWEPVIPPCADLTVCVVGASGIGKPAREACHCPELFCALTGASPDRPVDEATIALALNREDLADVYLVNQVDALDDPDRALRLCELIRKPASACALMPRRP